MVESYDCVFVVGGETQKSMTNEGVNIYVFARAKSLFKTTCIPLALFTLSNVSRLDCSTVGILSE